MNIFQKILILLGGFISYALADGYTYSFGVLYSYFLTSFQLSSTSTALLPGMTFAVPQLSALFLCPLLDAYGFSSGSAWGALLMCIGCVSSSFATDFLVLYFTLGVITSIGLQLTYCSALMAITAEFKNSPWFGLAIAFVMCGSGVGTFAWNPLLAYLLNFWNWREVLVIQGAILLNVLVTASCSHHLDAELSRNVMLSKPANQMECSEYENITSIHSQRNLQYRKKSLREYVCWQLKSSLRFCLCIPSLCRFKYDWKIINEVTSNQHPYQSVSILEPDTEEENDDADDVDKSCMANCSEIRKSLCSSLAQLFSRKLWTNSNYLIYLLANGITGAGVVIPWTFVYDYALTNLNTLSTNEQIGQINMTNISWLPSFIGIGLFIGQFFVGLITSQYGTLKDLRDSCKKDHLQSHTKQISQKNETKSYIYRLILFSFILLINGFSTLAIALIPLDRITSNTPVFSLFNHPEGIGLGVACFIVGITNGGLYVIYPQLLMDILGESLWPSGLGLFLAFNGIMNFIGTFFGGYINDKSGSYYYAFISSACLPFASLLLIIIYNISLCISKKFHTHQPENQSTNP